MNIRKFSPSPLVLFAIIATIIISAIMGQWQNPYAPDWINRSYILRGLLSTVYVAIFVAMLILVTTLLDMYDKWWHRGSKN